MKKRIATWLRRIAEWLGDEQDGHRLFVPFDGLYTRARMLTEHWDRHVSSGEHKRHQVYARLLKEFPDRPKRDIALAIEAVLR